MVCRVRKVRGDQPSRRDGSRLLQWCGHGQANILTEGPSKQQLGSGAIQPQIKQFGAQDRDLILLMTDGAWTRFSPYLLAQSVMKNLMNLPELPNSILKQAAKGGVCDDMTVVAIVVRRRLGSRTRWKRDPTSRLAKRIP